MVRVRRLLPVCREVLDTLSMPRARGAIDELDASILDLLTEDPAIGVLGASRRLGTPGARCRRGSTGSSSAG